MKKRNPTASSQRNEHPPPCCGSNGEKKPPIGDRNLRRGLFHGQLTTAIGDVALLRTELSSSDHLRRWLNRWVNRRRMRDRVEPGIYAVGNPGMEAPVLVTANYGMSLDALRRELTGIDAWILVLDTRGINVWCAAGKGTFGTEELIHRIAAVQLSRLVSHRLLILPQLGAPGISAHEVQKRSTFRVIYGPVRSADLPRFLAAGMKADPDMRRVSFTLRDRLQLIPMEWMGALGLVPLLIAPLLLLNLPGGPGYLQRLLPDLGFLLAALFAGAVLTPALLPWLPGRAFAVKGWFVGLLLTAALARVLYPGEPLRLLSSLLLFSPLSAFLAMNFTGASTFTSLSGVIREMTIAVPAMILSAIAGLVLRITMLF